MFDLRIEGGLVVGAEGAHRADIAIRDGRIAALPAPGEDAPARRRVAAEGCWLLPGLVDAHAHLREPGFTHKETFESGTRAAALGGVTTVLDMPTDEPWTVTQSDLAAKAALARGRLHVDVGFQVALSRHAIPEADPASLQAGGVVSFEIFTADVPDAFLFATMHDVAGALRRLGGATSGISAGDHSLLAGSISRPAPDDIAAFLQARPPLAEAAGVSRAVLAAAATGARIHVRQISSALGLDTFRRLRTLADATIETSPQNLFFTAADYVTQGARLKFSPPLRGPDDVAALRAALRDGTIDIVATDHAPHAPAEKAAPRFADIPGGMPGLQTLLQAMLKLVEAGVIGPSDITRLCARNPAQRFGLAARKGSIAPGRDADILVVDPRAPDTISDAAQASLAGYTPFAGWTVQGRLRRVFLRGREIVTDGVLSLPAGGRVLGPAPG